MNNEKEITKNYISNDFFDRVKNLVKQNSDYTIREFLISIEINPENYYSLRKLNNFPRCNDAQKIADALGVSLDYLVTGEVRDSGIFPYDNEIKNILEDLFALENDQREFLLFSLKNQIKYIKDSQKK